MAKSQHTAVRLVTIQHPAKRAHIWKPPCPALAGIPQRFLFPSWSALDD